MKHKTPKVLNGPIAEAYAISLNECEPIFAPTATYADDRGWSLMNMLQDVLQNTGQINCSVMYPGVVKAWHRHQQQTDFWIVLHGHLKVGIHREEDDTLWSQVIGDKRPGTLIIPPGLWHGASTVGPDSATLLYYVDKKYNPAAPDEERRAFDSVPQFPWTVDHR